MQSEQAQLIRAIQASGISTVFANTGYKQHEQKVVVGGVQMRGRTLHNQVKIKDFAYGNIKLQEPELLHACELEQLYLKSLDGSTSRGFMETAGCKPVAMRVTRDGATEIQDTPWDII